MSVGLYRNNFNAGLLTPLMDGRNDVAKYVEGCRYLENFLLMPYGGVRKRGGFEFINGCVSDTSKSRVIPFEVSRERSYIIELAQGFIRFFRNGRRVTDNDGNPIQIASPYQADDLDAIQFAQINDVMFIVHRNHHPRRLSRIADANWTLTLEDFKDAPFLDENIVETTKVFTSDTFGNIVDFESTAPIFKPEHVGSSWGVSHERSTGDFEVSKGFSSSGVSGTLKLQGTWAIITSGTWAGTLKLQRRAIGSAGAWEDYRTYTAANDRNIAPSESVDDLMEYRLSYAGGGNGSATLEARTLYVRGVVKITGYVSPTKVTVDVIRPLYSTAQTYRWSEAAWSEANGYPGAICFYEGRVFYAGTYREPQAGWASAGDNYTRFIKGTLDTDSFKFLLNATELNAILWMVADRRLIIGTSGGEWVLESRSNGGALTPSSAVPKPQSAIGSDPVQARLINSTVMFVDYGGRRLFDFNYDYNFDKYKENDLAFVGEQVTKGGILGLAYMRRPDPIVWAWNRDGELLGFTYMPKQSVAGWHPHNVGGHVESAAVIRGEGAVDELWITVRRSINGQVKRYLERMFPNAKDVQESGIASDFFYVDSGRTFVGTGVDQVTIGGAIPAGWKQLLKPAPNVAEPLVAVFRSWETATPPSTGFRSSLSVTDNGYDSFTFVWTLWSANIPTAIWSAEGSTPDVNAAGPWTRQLGPVNGPPTFVHDTGNIGKLTGMGHLEGQTVAILADGFVLADRQVVNGEVDLGGRRYLKVTSGLRVRSILQPMTLETTGPTGTSRFKRARVIKAVVNLWKTLGGRIGQEIDGPTDELRYRDESMNFAAPVPVFTGEKEMVFDQGYTRTPRVCIIHDDPLPCSVLSINAHFTYERS